MRASRSASNPNDAKRSPGTSTVRRRIEQLVEELRTQGSLAGTHGVAREVDHAEQARGRVDDAAGELLGGAALARGDGEPAPHLVAGEHRLGEDVPASHGELRPRRVGPELAPDRLPRGCADGARDATVEPVHDAPRLP